MPQSTCKLCTLELYYNDTTFCSHQGELSEGWLHNKDTEIKEYPPPSSMHTGNIAIHQIPC